MCITKDEELDIIILLYKGYNTARLMAHPEEEAGDVVLAMDVFMATGLL